MDVWTHRPWIEKATEKFVHIIKTQCKKSQPLQLCWWRRLTDSCASSMSRAHDPPSAYRPPRSSHSEIWTVLGSETDTTTWIRLIQTSLWISVLLQCYYKVIKKISYSTFVLLLLMWALTDATRFSTDLVKGFLCS